MTYKNLLIHLEGALLKITINREAKRNALNKETLEELHEVLTRALQDNQVKGLLLTGAGEKAFAAGADIMELSGLTVEEARSLAKRGQRQVFDLIYHAKKPVIAAINGYALGGGLELALACHFRIASDRAKLGLPEVSLGLIPGYGGTQRLTQLLGRGYAMEMILTGNIIDAEKALQIGLLNDVVPAEALLDKAYERLNDISKRSSFAMAAAIKAINAAVINPLEGYQVETEAFANCFGTPDIKEGIDAFLEKRRPNFDPMG